MTPMVNFLLSKISESPAFCRQMERMGDMNAGDKAIWSQPRTKEPGKCGARGERKGFGRSQALPQWWRMEKWMGMWGMDG